MMFKAFVQALLGTTKMMWQSQSQTHSLYLDLLLYVAKLGSHNLFFSANTHKLRTMT